jgi:hypothetical protein
MLESKLLDSNTFGKVRVIVFTDCCPFPLPYDEIDNRDDDGDDDDEHERITE